MKGHSCGCGRGGPPGRPSGLAKLVLLFISLSNLTLLTLQWKCDDTGVTENLWLNLSTGHIGSGRPVSGFSGSVLGIFCTLQLYSMLLDVYECGV